MSQNGQANPLVAINFQIPFDRIRPEHVAPAIDQLLADAQGRVEEIVRQQSPRTFENTMRPLDEMTERLDFAMSVVKHLESVVTSPELRTAYNAVQPKVSAFYSGIPLNEGLWKSVQQYAATDEAQGLTGAQKRYLTKTAEDFRRHGAQLDAAGKARLEALDVELSKVTTKFGENVLDSTNEFELMIVDERKLAGLPPSAVAAARASAQAKNANGWRFTLQAPSYVALMTYLDDAAIREQVYRAYTTRATSDGFDNRGILGRILELRREKAHLLGFENFAAVSRGAEREDRSAVSRRKRRARGLPPRHRRNGRAGARGLGYCLLRREATRGAIRFRRRSAAAVFPAGTCGGRII
jgi:oligopeptidase A